MISNILSKLSTAHFKRATAIKQKIEKLEKELTGLFHIPEPMTVGGTLRRHRRVSAAAGKKISTAAKARWAKMKAKRN